MKDEKMFPLQ